MALFTLLKYFCVLVAAILLGRWFDNVRRMALAKGKPWYTPWISAPGITIIIILLILITIRVMIK